MPRINKLHQLLDGVPVWTDELKEQAFKYLDAKTTPLHVMALAEVTGNELVSKNVWGQKGDVLRIIINQSSPQTLLQGWEWVRDPHRDQPQLLGDQ